MIDFFMQARMMRKTPIERYSAGLTPSDFNTVGDVKRRLGRRSLNDADELLVAIHGMDL
jgi:hypothetical protein